MREATNAWLTVLREATNACLTVVREATNARLTVVREATNACLAVVREATNATPALRTTRKGVTITAAFRTNFALFPGTNYNDSRTSTPTIILTFHSLIFSSSNLSHLDPLTPKQPVGNLASQSSRLLLD